MLNSSKTIELREFIKSSKIHVLLNNRKKKKKNPGILSKTFKLRKMRKQMRIPKKPTFCAFYNNVKKSL